MAVRGGQMLLRFVLIPADRSIPVSERALKVENVRLSCDAAYFIPALLKDGPAGFNNNANNLNMVLPFPTFNECQKENVPLFFFKRSESRDKQENCRAKYLLDVFSDKLSKRQNTFYGDVLVFWRKNVDETRHQMKLSDFTFNDITRFLGNKVCPVDNPEQGFDTTEKINSNSCTAQQQPVLNGDPHVGHLGSSRTSIAAKAVESNQQQQAAPLSDEALEQNHDIQSSHETVRVSPIGRDVIEETSREAKQPSTALNNNPAVPAASSENFNISNNNQHVEFNNLPTKQLFSGSHPIFVQESKRIDQRKSVTADGEADDASHSILGMTAGPRNSPMGFQHQQRHPDNQLLRHVLPASSAPQFTTTTSSTTNPSLSSMSNNQGIETSMHVLRRFLDVLSHQLPSASHALEALVSQIPIGSSVDHHDQRRLTSLTNALMESEVKEGRLQSDLLKLSSEVSQVTALNNTLNLQYQSLHDDFVMTQSSAQRFKEHSTRLLRDVGLLKEENLMLRDRISLLESEWRSSGRALPAESPVITTHHPTGSPTNQPTTGVLQMRKPLHHMKSSSNGGPAGMPAGQTINVSVEQQQRQLLQNYVQPLVSPNSPNSSRKWSREPSGGGKPAATGTSSALFPSRQFIVTQVYKPADTVGQEHFACLTEGEIVTVDREDDSGWWWVSNGKAAGSGWFPFSFLRPVQQH